MQRFGFLLEEFEIKEAFQEMIFADLNDKNFFPVLLSPKSKEKPGAVDHKWKIDVNVELEREL